MKNGRHIPGWLRVVLLTLAWVAVVGVGLYISLLVLFLLALERPVISIPVCTAVVLVYLLLVLLLAGQRKKRWFRCLAAAVGVVTLGCAGVIGYDAMQQAVTTVEERQIQLYQWQPFHADTRAVTLPEASALTLAPEEALTLRIDGATALYPVYASFVRNAFAPCVTEEDPVGNVYSGESLWCNGTNAAYERLIAGEVDVIFCAAPSERQLQAAADVGLTLHMTPIGREAFVFFVNSGNPVTGLTVQQVQGIYTGEITNWRELGGRNQAIRAYQRAEGSGSQTALQQLMAGLPLMEAPMEDVLADMGGVIRQVAAYRNFGGAIGYTFRFYANEMVGNDQIRLLALNGVEPTKETIRDGSYPISDCFYAVTASFVGEPAPEETDPVLGAFLDWCTGEQGQWIVEAVGYVSVE